MVVRGRRLDDSPAIYPEPGETLDAALRRLKKRVENASALSIYRDRQRFVPKPQRRRVKQLRSRLRVKRAA